MKLSSVMQSLQQKGIKFIPPQGRGNPSVSEVFSDSRRVTPASIFCCIKGEKQDGHDYVERLAGSGVAAFVCEHPVVTELPVIQVESARKFMGYLSATVYGEPSSKLMMIGVTGTNGKSTTTYIIRSVLEAAGIRTGLLGTIVESDGLHERDAERTTPESSDIQRQLAAMVKNGCGACVMETSSHGLQVGRLNGCLFDVAVFTNLNPEHLDFHLNMENYFQAKRLLFTTYAKQGFTGAVNGDVTYGIRLRDEFPQNIRTFAMKAEDAALTVKDITSSMDGSVFTITGSGMKDLKIKSPLVGEYNISNVLAAVCALRGRVDDAAIVSGIANIPQVPGRLEKYIMPNGACCIIDFAHTPEALRNVLSAVKGFCSGKLISIFGHGGGRYASNRPALGKVAASLADRIIVTMDNPRDEDPSDIAQAIVAGIKEQGSSRYQTILDRKEAILTALSVAEAGDVIVISGKGPEKFLTIKDQKIPYNDAETVKAWMQLSAKGEK